MGAEAADSYSSAAEAAASKAAASKTLENDLEDVYTHSGGKKRGQKGSGVLKSIMGMFSPSDSSDGQYKHHTGSSEAAHSSNAHPSTTALGTDSTFHSRRGEEIEQW